MQELFRVDSVMAYDHLLAVETVYRTHEHAFPQIMFWGMTCKSEV